MIVMPAFIAGIHAISRSRPIRVDARNKYGHPEAIFDEQRVLEMAIEAAKERDLTLAHMTAATFAMEGERAQKRQTRRGSRADM